MAGLGVSVAVFDDTGRILLQQREDFEVWGLPAGEIDTGETAAQAAVREVREESGLDVQLTRMIGLYALPTWLSLNNHNVVFAATPVGGQLLRQTAETVDAGFFAPDNLPQPLVPWHAQRIADAFAGLGGSVAVMQDMQWPFDANVTRQELYALRDQSGMSRQAFFLQMMADGSPITNKREVGP